MKRFGALALVIMGCSVGQGTGSAAGPLTILDCGGTGKNFPPTDKPAEPYDLQPRFFGAEQLLDLTNGQTKQNRLIIRLQNNGRRREVSDILRFDITNLYEVARCVRGGTKMDGTDDFDTRDCARTPTGVRVRVGPNALVTSSLTPNFTCSTKVQIYDHVGTADSNPRVPNDGNWDSWIIFATLGSATNPNAKFTPDFKIDLDDPLDASHFQLTIKDDAVVTAVRDPLMPPVPLSHISGTLEGEFHFNMQRGQGAQTFP